MDAQLTSVGSGFKFGPADALGAAFPRSPGTPASPPHAEGGRAACPGGKVPMPGAAGLILTH